MTFVESLRRRKSSAFDLEQNSSGRRAVEIELFGKSARVYANANLSIYSAQSCNAKCPFCVEELRPASRGGELAAQKTTEYDDEVYFGKLNSVLTELRPLNPSISITGGEPSKDRRLPGILRTVAAHVGRKRTITTNGSGLLDAAEGRQVIDWIAETGTRHLNISRAHPDPEMNAKLMVLRDGLSLSQLKEVIVRAKAAGTRVRLSCVLLRGAIDDVAGIVAYLAFARSIGVDNVIFRQLMKTDSATVQENSVVRYSDTRRVQLERVLDELSLDQRFRFAKQIVGYYYYVEVWRYGEMDVVFEEADLKNLEAEKARDPRLIHELIYHPNARLCSTWQPWDGILG